MRYHSPHFNRFAISCQLPIRFTASPVICFVAKKWRGVHTCIQVFPDKPRFCRSKLGTNLLLAESMIQCNDGVKDVKCTPTQSLRAAFIYKQPRIHPHFVRSSLHR